MSTVQFDLSGTGLVKFGTHPTVQDYMQGSFDPAMVDWFASYGYAVDPTFDVNLLEKDDHDFYTSVFKVDVPEHLAVLFKLTWL